jgi:hypothetical protein
MKKQLAALLIGFVMSILSEATVSEAVNFDQDAVGSLPRDGPVEVRFKPISGREDAAGGAVWR